MKTESNVFIWGGGGLVDADKKYNERRELVDIYNNLPSPLKKQLMAVARIIDATREITLSEGKRKRVKKQESPTNE